MNNSIKPNPVVIGLFCSACTAFIPHRIQFLKVDDEKKLLYYKTCMTCSLEDGPIAVVQEIWNEICRNGTKGIA